MICAELKDFIPLPLDGDSYEGFETLTERANVWLKEQENIVHVSLQSVLVQKGDGMYAFSTFDLEHPFCLCLSCMVRTKRTAESGSVHPDIDFTDAHIHFSMNNLNKELD